MLFDTQIGIGRLVLLGLALLIVFGFEFVNGFHDTANAVATVIYTRSLRPWVAVVWSGLCNFLGVSLGGIAVAMGIIKLLPVELLASSGSGAGLAMVLSLLLAAILWNLGTWYLGLPASSSHTLIGAIVGVGLANSLRPGHTFGEGVNWHKVQEVALSLVVSPLFGLAVAAALLWLARKVLKSTKLHEPADPNEKPPLWIRILLVGTCSGVSFAHGSNDGQKGVGLVMLILIGILPADFAIDRSVDHHVVEQAISATHTVEAVARAAYPETEPQNLAANTAVRVVDSPAATIVSDLAALRHDLSKRPSLAEVPPEERWGLRSKVQRVEATLSQLEKAHPNALSKEQADTLKKNRAVLKSIVEYAPRWVLVGVALALGIGTMIGWKRIVVTVGEKIGKTHMSYSQGAAAEIVAASTIAASTHLGLPVSTTHVLSSGIAGTMLAQKSGLQKSTVRNIALAWIFTLPASVLLAACLFAALRAVIPDANAAVDISRAGRTADEAPRAVSSEPLRLRGSNTIGAKLAPQLVEAFFASKGATGITRRAGDAPHKWSVSATLAGESLPRVVEIDAAGTATAFEGLAARAVDIGLASRRATPEEAANIASAGLGDILSPASEHVIGLDGVAIVVNGNNPARVESLAEVAGIFRGDVVAWPETGMPIHVYARDEHSGTFDVFRSLVLADAPLAKTAKTFLENAQLADAVAADPEGVGFVPMSMVREARSIAIGDGDRAIYPSEFTVSTEAYPLTRRLYLYTPQKSQKPLVQDIVAFTLSAEGQKVVRNAGFVDLSIRTRAAESCTRCPASYARLTAGAQRLSLDVRFRTGTTELDNRALKDIERVVSFAATRPQAKVAVLGFSDNVGSSDANLELSRERARAVERQLRAHGVRPSTVEGFGEALPVTSNTTAEGRQHNRRVELWLLP